MCLPAVRHERNIVVRVPARRRKEPVSRSEVFERVKLEFRRRAWVVRVREVFTGSYTRGASSLRGKATRSNLTV